LTPESFADLIKLVGLPLALTIAILWAGARGIWVYGWVFKMVEKDRDAWRAQAESGTNLADKAIEAPPPRRNARVRP
jgi:hypothetical protein